jgi:hypothetical protein
VAFFFSMRALGSSYEVEGLTQSGFFRAHRRRYTPQGDAVGDGCGVGMAAE